MKQISVRLDDELHNKVKHLLVDIEKSFNEYVIELIKQDLEKRKQSVATLDKYVNTLFHTDRLLYLKSIISDSVASVKSKLLTEVLLYERHQKHNRESPHERRTAI